jgi:hypothetical protein
MAPTHRCGGRLDVHIAEVRLGEVQPALECGERLDLRGKHPQGVLGVEMTEDRAPAGARPDADHVVGAP